jgi:hypothetical protein
VTEVSYASLRGLTVGAGSDLPWASMPQGLDLINERSAVQVPGVDGQRFTGPDQVAPVLVTFDSHVLGDTPAARLVALNGLRAAWAPVRSGVLPLTLALNGTEAILYGRPSRCDADMRKLALGSLRTRYTFESSDPRLYDATESAVVLGLEPGGGMVFPLEFPLSFGSGSDTDGSVENAGNAETQWTAVIAGPVVSPRLTLGSTGQYVAINGTVPEGSTLVISSANHSILLDGSPRNWLTLTSRWWSLAPGVNTVRFRAASGTGSCTFSWRSASWL